MQQQQIIKSFNKVISEIHDNYMESVIDKKQFEDKVQTARAMTMQIVYDLELLTPIESTELLKKLKENSEVYLQNAK